MTEQEKISILDKIEEQIITGLTLASGEKVLGLPPEELSTTDIIDKAIYNDNVNSWDLVAINYEQTIILLSAKLNASDTRPIPNRDITYDLSYVEDIDNKTFAQIFKSPIPSHKVILENEKLIVTE